MPTHNSLFITTLIDRSTGEQSRVDNIVKNAPCQQSWEGATMVTTDEIGECTIYGFQNSNLTSGHIEISSAYLEKSSKESPIVITIKDEDGNAATNDITITLEGGLEIDGESFFLIDDNYGCATIYLSGDYASVTNYYVVGGGGGGDGTVFTDYTIGGDGSELDALSCHVLLQSDQGLTKFLNGAGAYSIPNTMYNFSDSFSGDITANIASSGSSLTITDSRASPVGIQYGASYKDTFTDQSLVDKEYVDSVGFSLVLETDATGDTSSVSSGNNIVSILNSVTFENSDYVDTSDAGNKIIVLTAGMYTIKYCETVQLTAGTGTLSQYVFVGSLLLDGTEYKKSRNTARIYFANGSVDLLTLQNDTTLTVTEGQTIELQWYKTTGTNTNQQLEDNGQSTSMSIFKHI